VLNVCLVGEPDTLYLYGGSDIPAAHHVMEALYDGPIDHRAYGYQPVILRKLPSLSDGDAVTRTVTVREGDRVMDADGDVVEIDRGVRIRPSGCYATGCEVTFEGGAVLMERMEATFALRRDVTWSDGVPLTAKDSEFGYKVASDPATPGYRRLTERSDRYWAVDQWHTTWIGVPGFLDSSYVLNFFPPLPRHQLEDHPVAELARLGEVRRMPLGWGAFVVEEWVPGDHITLSPNRAYFRADDGLPHVDRVVFRIMADKEAAAVGILSGSCDIGTEDAGFVPLLQLLIRLEEQDLLRVVSAPAERMVMLTFNVRPATRYRNPGLFTTPRVRQAVSHCVDRQALLDEIALGLSVAPGSYVPPAHPLYADDELARWEFDPVRGHALLDEIGWRDVDQDGVREAQDVEGFYDGEPLVATLLTSDDPASLLETSRILRAQLADCGIRVNVEALSDQQLDVEDPESLVYDRPFHLLVSSWSLDGARGCDRYVSWQIPEVGAQNGANVAGYSSLSFDAACGLAQEALPGTPGHERHHREAQIIFSQELPALPLFMHLRVALARREVGGFEMDATAESSLWALESLRVDSDVSGP
jgi:peptide/nickel transport system substrate-binding protein